MEFCRQLRLAENFYDLEMEGDNDNSLVQNRSTFTPNRNKNQALDTFCENITKFPIEAVETNYKKSNFKKQQWDALEELSNDQNIIIKEADKGSAIVIMNKEDYKDMVLEIIKDTEYYVESVNYKQKNILQKLESLVNKHRDSFTKKEVEYLIKFSCKSSNFYGLPKIHKSKSIQKSCEENYSTYLQLTKPKDFKLRPIVAGPACETHRLSNFFGYYPETLLEICEKSCKG